MVHTVPMKKQRLLELALETLIAKRAALDAEMEDIRKQLGLSSSVGGDDKPVPRQEKSRRGRRRSRTPEERKAQAERMKKYWAKRKAKGKAGAK